MIAYSQKDVALNIRTLLQLNFAELPKFQIMDAQLWLAVRKALAAESAAKELDWLDLGPAVSEAVRTAGAEVIGRLAESAVCSFVPLISEDDFLSRFGRQGDWSSLQKDARINYYRARFGSIYWCSVRDYAVKSRTDCMSFFHIPYSIAEVVAESTTSQVIDYCHGYPEMQRFGLSCDKEACLRVAEAARHAGSVSGQLRLLRARLIKSNHCAACGPAA